MGRQGGNLSLWGPERFFSFVVIVILTYPLFGRAHNVEIICIFPLAYFVSSSRKKEHKMSITKNKTSIPTTIAVLVVSILAVAITQAGDVPPRGTVQRAIASVERMPHVPEPLAVRDWRAVSRSYYKRILDPDAVGDGFPVVEIKADKAAFRMKSYVGSKLSGEAVTSLSVVVGARLAGLDPRNLHGIDYVSRCKAWYDPAHGFYRHTVGDRSSVVHSGIYGYWNAIVGTMLAAQYPEDTQFKHQAITAARAFHVIARGLGCPDRPDYDVLGWDFENEKPGGATSR